MCRNVSSLHIVLFVGFWLDFIWWNWWMVKLGLDWDQKSRQGETGCLLLEALKGKSNISKYEISRLHFHILLFFTSLYVEQIEHHQVHHREWENVRVSIFLCVDHRSKKMWSFVDFYIQYLHFHFIYLFPMPDISPPKWRRWKSKNGKKNQKIIKKIEQQMSSSLINEFSFSHLFIKTSSCPILHSHYVYFSLDPDFHWFSIFVSVYLLKKFVKSIFINEHGQIVSVVTWHMWTSLDRIRL